MSDQAYRPHLPDDFTDSTAQGHQMKVPTALRKNLKTASIHPISHRWPMKWMAVASGFVVLALVMGGDTLNAQQGPEFTRETPSEISGGGESPSAPLETPTGDKDYRPQRVPLAPQLQTTIEGININEDAVNNGGFRVIPPDPFGVAGPDHLVSVVNRSIEWFTKDGTLQNSQSLSSFFGTLTPLTRTFDPKVIYDQYAGRFVVVALEATDTARGGAANTSRILLAVSDDSDPNGSWHFQAINSKTNLDPDGAGPLPSVDHWADYPGFAVDDEVVYISNNMFTFGADDTREFGDVRLWILPKGLGSGGLYDGGIGTVTIHSPCDGFGLPLRLCFTLQPAHMFGTAPTGVGTFLTVLSGIFLEATGNEVVFVIRVDDPLGTPSFDFQAVDVGNLDNGGVALPDAPQLGTTALVEVNDRRALHSVWRNDSLFVVNTINPNSGPDAGQTTAHWFE